MCFVFVCLFFFTDIMASKYKRFKFNVREIDNDSVQTQRLPLSSSTAKKHESITHMEIVPEIILPTVEGIQTPSSPPPPESSKGYSSTHASSSWTAVRQQLVDVHFEIQFSEYAACTKQIGAHHIRCKDCGQQTYYCSENCCSKMHTWDRNPFHKPMQWKVCHFRFD